MVSYSTIESPALVATVNKSLLFVPQIEADTAANGWLQALTMAKYEL